MAGLKESLEITIEHGTEEGTLICSLKGWDCEIYRISRDELSAYTNNSKLKECGIYFLVGEYDGAPSVYVGQANSRDNGKGVLGRVMEHDRASEAYWNTALLLHSTSNGLYPTELNYLERSFWNKVKMSSFKVMNASKPALGNYAESTEIAMDKFIASAEMIIRILGYRFLDAMPKTAPESPETIPGKIQFFIKRKGKVPGRDIDAVCVIKEGKFVVLKGSLVATVPRDSNHQKNYNHSKYADLIDQKGILRQDIAFDSVSGSSAFVIYGSSNGNVDWKDSEGKPIKDYLL